MHGLAELGERKIRAQVVQDLLEVHRTYDVYDGGPECWDGGEIHSLKPVRSAEYVEDVTGGVEIELTDEGLSAPVLEMLGMLFTLANGCVPEGIRVYQWDTYWITPRMVLLVPKEWEEVDGE